MGHPQTLQNQKRKRKRGEEGVRQNGRLFEA